MKKIGIIVLALVLMLGAVGVGYAYWTQTINVTAAVQTGVLSAQFAGNDAVNLYDDAPNNVSYYLTTGNGSDTLTVTIKNAYPGLTATIPVVIKNNGTIPSGNIAYASNMSWLPSGSTAVLTGSELPGGLAAGASTSDAKITVSIPLGASPSDPVFNQNDTSSYAFTMAITSTQFVPAP